MVMCQIQRKPDGIITPPLTNEPPKLITTSELGDSEDQYYYDYYYCNMDKDDQRPLLYEDLSEAYQQILEVCRPYYSLHPPTGHSVATASSSTDSSSEAPTSVFFIPPRLEDALALQTNDSTIGSVVTSSTSSSSSF